MPMAGCCNYHCCISEETRVEHGTITCSEETEVPESSQALSLWILEAGLLQLPGCYHPRNWFMIQPLSVRASMAMVSASQACLHGESEELCTVTSWKVWWRSRFAWCWVRSLPPLIATKNGSRATVCSRNHSLVTGNTRNMATGRQF